MVSLYAVMPVSCVMERDVEKIPDWMFRSSVRLEGLVPLRCPHCQLPEPRTLNVPPLTVMLPTVVALALYSPPPKFKAKSPSPTVSVPPVMFQLVVEPKAMEILPFWMFREPSVMLNVAELLSSGVVSEKKKEFPPPRFHVPVPAQFTIVFLSLSFVPPRENRTRSVKVVMFIVAPLSTLRRMPG